MVSAGLRLSERRMNDMEKTSQPKSKKKVGAPLGNTNALKYGRYSRLVLEAREKRFAELLDRCNNESLFVKPLILNVAQVLLKDPLIPVEDILLLLRPHALADSASPAPQPAAAANLNTRKEIFPR